ncbi:MAG: hypothetical protein KBA46_07140 [Candidatus Omnitrophica bacterium]|nr:hypothetical protein [Candidatus Omnitrophota bacterium]
MRFVYLRKHLFIILSLGFVLFLNIFYRSFPIHFPQLKQQAKSILDQNIQQAVADEVNRQFPQYYPLAKEQLIKDKTIDYKRHQVAVYNKQVDELYKRMKERFQDDAGQTYLMELDCWHWARYTENVVKKGHPGDMVIANKQVDSLMLNPTGDILPWNSLLFYLSAFLFKIVAFFKPISVYSFAFYLPLFYIAVCVAVIYFFTLRFGGIVGAFISCLSIGLAPIFIPRSCAGWFDMDTLSMTLPIVILWTYLKSSQAPAWSKGWIGWIAVTSLFVGVFSFLWTSWWFIFLIIVIFELLRVSFSYVQFLRDKNIGLRPVWQRLSTTGVFIGLSFIAVLLLSGLRPLAELYQIVSGSLVLNKPLLPTIWPNVYATVGELRKANFVEIAHSTGGLFVFWISIVAMVWLMVRAVVLRAYDNFKKQGLFILVLWFLIMLYATIRGVRFTMFLTVPLGIALGWFCGDLYALAKRKLPWLGLGVAIVLISSFTFIFANKASAVIRGVFPLMDDTWFKVLTTIKEQTPTDSVLNSWWDFGDWFKVVAQRKVIFDGQSQNKPQAYWMAKAFLSGNEDESMGILRMLNNGGNRAFEIIEENLHDPLKSVLLLERILPLDPQQAKELLLGSLPVPVVDQVMNIVFGRPPQAYFLVDPSLPSKISAISYIGNWNFAKVYIAQSLNKYEKDEITTYLTTLGRNPQQVENFYQEAYLITSKNIEGWISRPYQFYSGVVNGVQKGDVVLFDNGFTYNIQEQTIFTNNRQIPRSLFIEKDSSLIEVVYTNPNLVFSALVFKNGQDYKLLLLDRELGASLFVKLYFLNGRGLRHFKPFIDSQQGNDYIRVFTVAW